MAGTIAVEAVNGTVREGDYLTVRLTRDGDTSSSLSVPLTFTPSGADGATPNNDFYPPSYAYFASGSTTASLQIFTRWDSLVEPTERLTLAIDAPAGYTAGPPVALAITDRGFSTYSIASAVTNAIEGQPLSVTIERSGDVSEAGYIILDVAGAGGVLPQRDVAIPYSVEFAAGETSKVLSLDTFLDRLSEGSEQFTVTISDANTTTPYAVGPTNSATFTIADRDIAAEPAPTVSVATTDGSGGPEDGWVFTFTRSGDLSAALAVNYAIVELPGSDIGLIHAVGGWDPITGNHHRITFAAGESTATLTMTPTEGSVVNTESTFAVALEPGVDYVKGAADMAFGTFTPQFWWNSNGVEIEFSLAPAASNVAEGGTLTFQASHLDSSYRDLSQPLTVTVRAVSLTPFNDAGSDIGTATITFEAWQKTATGTIQVSSDSVAEGSERFVLVVDPYDPSSNLIFKNRPATEASVFTVVEAAPVLPEVAIAATTASASEGDALVATLTRTGDLTEPLTVTLELGTAKTPAATAGQDFVAPSATVTFAADSASATVTLATYRDVLAEATEHLTLSVRPSSAYTVAGSAGSARFDIVDRVPPTVTVAATDAAAAEGAAGDTLGFTFTRTGDLSEALTVTFGMGGSAAPGFDHTGAAYDTVTFAAGSATAAKTFGVFDDVRIEGAETVSVSLVQPTGRGASYIVGAQGSADATIADNDPESWPTVSIGAARASVGEGGEIAFTLTRTGGGTGEVQVYLAYAGHGAQAGSDFWPPAAVVTIPTGQSSVTVPVRAFPDALVEGDEAFSISIKAADGYTIANGAGTATFTIVDQEPIEIASVSSAGIMGNAASSTWSQSLSGDGRYLVFSGEATNLVAGDTNGTSDVFLRDLQAKTTTSLTLGGNEHSGGASISADGRFVAFHSNAINLVAEEDNRQTDIFLLERATGTTVNLTDGANDGSFLPTVSADGRYVAFYSGATNLVADDTNGAADVFVRDTQTGATTRVTNGAAHSFFPQISGDGRMLTFLSYDPNLDAARPADPIGYVFSYVADLAAGTITRLEGSSNTAVVSSDGRFVAYAANVPATDGSEEWTVETRILDRSTGQSTYLAAGAPTDISPDGRYVLVNSHSSVLTVVDRVTGDTRQATPGAHYGFADGSAMSDDGRTVIFVSGANNLVPGYQAHRDVFVTHLPGGADVLPVVSLSTATASASEGGTLAYTVTRTGDLSQALTVKLSAVGSGANPAGPGADFVAPTTATIAAGAASATVSFLAYPDASAEAPEGLTLSLVGTAAYAVASGAGSATFTIVDAAPASAAPTERISVATDGAQGNAASQAHHSSLSADGRYAVFSSNASNLAPGDTNPTYDIVLRDLKNGTTTLVTAGANGHSGPAAISLDGRTIAYSSSSTALVAGDTNGHADIFVYDRASGTTINATAGSNGDSYNPTLSADGRTVSFYSNASNLSPGDTNNTFDIFVRDLDTGVTTRVTPGTGAESAHQTMSADGKVVVFRSADRTLDPNHVANPDSFYNLYVTDLSTGQTRFLDEGGNPAFVSGDGRYVAYQRQTRVDNSDGTVTTDNSVYLLDRTSGTTTSVSGPANGTAFPSGISPDGRFVLYTGVDNTFSNTQAYVYDRETGTATPVASGANGPTYGESLSADGRTVLLSSDATNLVAGDTNGVRDVLVAHIDPARPVVTIAASTASASEGGTLAYTVTRTGDLSEALTVQVAAAGSGPNPASPGTDFAVPLNATIAAGQSSATVSFVAATDAAAEMTEGLTVSLAPSPGYAVGGSGRASFTIVDVPVQIDSPVVTGLLAFSDTGASSGDGITRTVAPWIGGTAASGTQVDVYVDGAKIGTASAGSTGWSIKAPAALSEGDHVVTAVAFDGAGNRSQASNAYGITIDTTAPAAALTTVSAATTGAAITVGGYSTTGAVHVEGTGEVGATVRVFDGSALLGTTSVGSNGAWDFDVGTVTPLSEGSHRLTARATDTAGNSTTTASLSFTVDTVAPLAPVVTGLLAFSDTGASSSDGVTRTVAPWIVGTAASGALVDVYVDGVRIGTATSDATGWSIKAPAALAEGEHAVTAVAIDAAGNRSTASSPYGLVIDTTAPSVALTGVSASATGAPIVGGGYSATGAVHVEGTGEVGATVRVSDGATAIGTAVVGWNGVWELDIGTATPLSEGLHRLSARATDTAGNAATTASFAFTVDTIVPSAPTVTGLQAFSDTGASSTDGVTRSVAPWISGTAPSGALVDVFVDGARIGTATAGSDGWSIKAPSALAEGDHVLTAVTVDAAGNRSAASNAYSITIDTTAPVVALTGVSAAATGAVVPANGFSTTGRVRVEGTGETGTVVQVYEGTKVLGTAVVGASGAWDLELGTSTPLTEGLHRLSAKAADTAGNSATAASFAFTVDTIAPSAPTVTGLLAFSDSGASNSDGVTRTTAPWIAGTAPSGANVEVFVDGARIGSVTASSTGWSIKAPTALFDGHHVVTAKTIDAAGNRSTVSNAYDLEIDTTAPAASPIDRVTSARGVTSDGYTTDTTFELSGRAEIGSSLKLYDGAKLIGTPIVDATGQWTARYDGTGLADATHSFTVRTTDLAGNAGPISAAKTVVVDTQAPAPAMSAVSFGASTLTLTGRSETGSQVSIRVDGVEVDPANPAVANTSQAWTKVIARPSDAVHTLELQAVDKAGNAGGGANVTIIGSTGADTIEGSAGRDLIYGGSGSDTIAGGAGADTITGGGGNDTFVFRLGEAQGDSVPDFAGAGAPIGDRLEFRGFGAGWLEQVLDVSGNKTDSYVVHADAAHGDVTETIRITGVTLLDVQSGPGHNDILFV